MINALKKEKYLFQLNQNSIYKKILVNPEEKFINKDYNKTLKTISHNFSDFYDGGIGKEIIKTVKDSKNPGFINFSDLKLYNPKKQLKLFVTSLTKISHYAVLIYLRQVQYVFFASVNNL